MRKAWIAILLLGVPAFGQPDSNAITVTASRTYYLSPDQVRISVVSVPDGASPDDIIAALRDTVTAVDKSDPLARSLSLTVPVAKIGETIASLRQLGVSFSVTGTEPSTQAACPRSDLIADATAQARRLAAAAGLSVGRILAVSNSGPPPGIAIPAARQGDFSQLIGVPFPNNVIPVISPSPTTACSLTVKFAFGR